MSALTAYVIDRRLIIALPLLLLVCPLLAADLASLSIPGKASPMPTAQFLPLVASSVTALTLPERMSWVLPPWCPRVMLLRFGVAIVCVGIPVVIVMGMARPGLTRPIIGMTLLLAAATYFVSLINVNLEWVAPLAGGSTYVLLPQEATNVLSRIPVLAGVSGMFLLSVVAYAIRYAPNVFRD